MDYVCLIYLNEGEMDALPPAEIDVIDGKAHWCMERIGAAIQWRKS
jgi:hypothetical protein